MLVSVSVQCKYVHEGQFYTDHFIRYLYNKNNSKQTTSHFLRPSTYRALLGLKWDWATTLESTRMLGWEAQSRCSRARCWWEGIPHPRAPSSYRSTASPDASERQLKWIRLLEEESSTRHAPWLPFSVKLVKVKVCSHVALFSPFY